MPLPIEPDHHAFPMFAQDYTFSRGLTKREYLAAIALQGLLANSAFTNSSNSSISFDSRIAVEYADALIKELNK